MKTMTCRQLGGPCNFAVKGNTADEIIIEGEKHIKEMVAEGDVTHNEVMKKMENMRKDPKSGMDWYKKTQADFEAADDNA